MQDGTISPRKRGREERKKWTRVKAGAFQRTIDLQLLTTTLLVLPNTAINGFWGKSRPMRVLLLTKPIFRRYGARRD